MREFIAGLLLMAIGASAKSVIDVQVLKAKNESLKEIVIEIRNDVKDLRNHIME